jgi:hypothetical protein
MSRTVKTVRFFFRLTAAWMDIAKQFWFAFWKRAGMTPASRNVQRLVRRTPHTRLPNSSARFISVSG